MNYSQGVPPSPGTQYVAPLLAEPLTADPFRNLERRKWLYGNWLLRGYLSLLAAPGGTGKTAYGLAVAGTILLDDAVLGEQIHDATRNVWYINLEDSREEMLLRLQAFCIAHGVNPDELAGRLFLNSGQDRRLIIAQPDGLGMIMPSPDKDQIIMQIQANNIGLIIIDPFAGSHYGRESNAEDMAVVMDAWKQVAKEGNCAVLLIHHTRKGGNGNGDGEDFRGSTAIINAARAAVGLVRMGENDQLGVDKEEWWQYLRLYNAKLNLAPPTEKSLWFKLVPVELPCGESVQTVKRWDPKGTLFEGLDMATCVRVLETIADGLPDGEQYRLTKQGPSAARWAGTLLIAEGKNEQQAKRVLKAWEKSGVLVETTYRSKTARRDQPGVSVNTALLHKMRCQVS